MKLGIVGLPNVGKSTLFNSLTKAGALAANYPFATIEPNVGVVTVPDKRLDFLKELFLGIPDSFSSFDLIQLNVNFLYASILYFRTDLSILRNSFSFWYSKI